MRNLWVVIVVCGWLVCIGLAQAKNFSQIQDLYKKIGEDLVSLRKEYAAGQPKIYTILDKVDRMYNLTKGIHQKKKSFKRQMGDRESIVKTLKDENKILKEELFNAKQAVDSTEKQLEVTNKKLEVEKSQASKLSQEKGALLGKIKQIESDKGKSLDLGEKDVEEQLKNIKTNQSLTLSSTSAPSSPR